MRTRKQGDTCIDKCEEIQAVRGHDSSRLAAHHGGLRVRMRSVIDRKH